MINLLSVADLVTLLNAVLGFLALILVFSDQFVLAASLILLGLLADGLDGIVARRLGNGKIGEYLEPLADMISLSIAPLALFYKMYYEHVVSEPWMHLFLGIVLVFSLICSVIRLSSFSLLKKQQFFIGLPTSASAMFLVAITYFTFEVWYLLPVIVVISLAMISSIRFPKLSWKVNLIAAAFILATIVLQNRYSTIAPILLLIALLIYIIMGPIYIQLKKRHIPTETTETRN